MGLFGYLVLGALMYLVGFMTHQKILKKHRQGSEQLAVSHPVLLQCLAVCFVIMLAVSALIGRFVLGHTGFDWAFIGVNSLVATVVFYFGANPDTTKMRMPD